MEGVCSVARVSSYGLEVEVEDGDRDRKSYGKVEHGHHCQGPWSFFSRIPVPRFHSA